VSRRFFLALSWTTSSWRGIKKPFSFATTTDLVRLTLLHTYQRNDSFDSWLWNGFLERALRIKPILLFPFFFLILFNYAIQGKFITWLVNSALNCSWKPILYESFRDECDIGFQVQFNAEFTSQVMYFPIVCTAPIFTRVHCAKNNTRMSPLIEPSFFIAWIPVRKFALIYPWRRSCLTSTTLAFVPNAVSESLKR